MSLVGMKDMLRAARRGGYAVGAFNIVDYNSLRAVAAAAEAESAPVIIQTSVKTVVFWGEHTLFSWVEETAENVDVPVALHLDHCKDPEMIDRCIAAGWTSVMIDASSRPFEENLALSRQVVEAAESAGVDVEAELGEIGGVEDDIRVAEADAHLADPDKAERFCRELSLAAFAPAIGTMHGVYKGEPRIAFDRLEEIARRTDTPLALHGGTGLSDGVFRRAIALGCAKVNISTQLKHAFIDGFVEYHTAHAAEYNPLTVLASQFERVRDEMAANMRLFGSAGKAAGGS